jgi:FKBP-type peptidyl-prolyl cis-trans isomerase
MKYMSFVAISAVSLALMGCHSADVRSIKKAGASSTTSEGMPKRSHVDPQSLVVPASALVGAGGARFQVLRSGAGAARPVDYDSVELDYVGYGADGRAFDETRTRGRADRFEVARVMPAWRDALRGMTEGAVSRIWVPPGQTGWLGKTAPSGPLVFDVELVRIVPGKAPIPPPSDVGAPPANAHRSKTGLSSLVLAAGAGADRARPDDRVRLNFTGWTPDGGMFASSITDGAPITLDVQELIPAWREALTSMAPGGKLRLWSPEALTTPGPVSLPKGPLVFDLELLAIEHLPPPPPAPKDVARVPSSARRTPSGLAFRVVKAGSGTRHPESDARVTVDYTAWTPDGQLVDTTVKAGLPKTVSVSALTSGWKEGLGLMVEGDKVLFWMPAELAYKGQPGAPQGMVVLKIELVKILG